MSSRRPIGRGSGEVAEDYSFTKAKLRFEARQRRAESMDRAKSTVINLAAVAGMAGLVGWLGGPMAAGAIVLFAAVVEHLVRSLDACG